MAAGDRTGARIRCNVQRTRRTSRLNAWFAWLALPLAAWALWLRRQATDAEILRPCPFFAIASYGLGSFTGPQRPALLLLPPLALLAIARVA